MVHGKPLAVEHASRSVFKHGIKTEAQSLDPTCITELAACQTLRVEASHVRPGELRRRMYAASSE